MEETHALSEKGKDKGGNDSDHKNNDDNDDDDSSDDKDIKKNSETGEMDAMKAQLDQLIDYSLRCLDCDKSSSLKEEIVVKYITEGIYLCNKCMKKKLEYLVKNNE